MARVPGWGWTNVPRSSGEAGPGPYPPGTRVVGQRVERRAKAVPGSKPPPPPPSLRWPSMRADTAPSTPRATCTCPASVRAAQHRPGDRYCAQCGAPITA